MPLGETDDAESVRMVEYDLVMTSLSVDVGDVVGRVGAIMRGDGTRRGGHLFFFSLCRAFFFSFFFFLEGRGRGDRAATTFPLKFRLGFPETSALASSTLLARA